MKVFLRKLSNRCFKGANNIHPCFQLIGGTKTAEVCLADIWNTYVLCCNMLHESCQTKASPCFSVKSCYKNCQSLFCIWNTCVQHCKMLVCGSLYHSHALKSQGS